MEEHWKCGCSGLLPFEKQRWMFDTCHLECWKVNGFFRTNVAKLCFKVRCLGIIMTSSNHTNWVSFHFRLHGKKWKNKTNFVWPDTKSQHLQQITLLQMEDPPFQIQKVCMFRSCPPTNTSRPILQLGSLYLTPNTKTEVGSDSMSVQPWNTSSLPRPSF